MDCSGELPFDPMDIYKVLIDYFKDRFGPDYTQHLNDYSITY